jgi:hypothetical protein
LRAAAHGSQKLHHVHTVQPFSSIKTFFCGMIGNLHVTGCYAMQEQADTCNTAAGALQSICMASACHSGHVPVHYHTGLSKQNGGEKASPIRVADIPHIASCNAAHVLHRHTSKV